MRHLAIVACILIGASCMASQAGMCTTVVVWPQSAPVTQVPAKPKCQACCQCPIQCQPCVKSLGSMEKERTRKAAALKARDDQDRMDKAIQDEKIRRWSATAKIDPDKDEYRKYLADKQTRAETLADEDAPLMQEFYREQDARNDYRKWKDAHPMEGNDEFKAWRSKRPSEPEKVDEDKLDQDLRTAFSGQVPVTKSKEKEE